MIHTHVTEATKLRFWMSGEIQGDIDDASYIAARKAVEQAVNAQLGERDYGRGLKLWAYLSIILNPEIDRYYPEVKRYSKRKKEVEFRLKIDHNQFVHGDHKTHLRLLAESVLRSLDLMQEMNIKDLDLDKLTIDVTQCLSKYLK